jgi:F-type H+-transporting ATPase subunit delta
MAELATVARPYAEALFRVAKEGNTSTSLNAWSELVSEMAQVAANPDMKALSHNPNLPRKMIADALLSAVKSPLTQDAQNFIENGRVSLLEEIDTQFQALKNAQEGAADAAITSAFAMSGPQVEALVATLEKRFGRKLNPSVVVDETLIGGVRVVVGDEVLDTSVRAKLHNMHTALIA